MNRILDLLFANCLQMNTIYEPDKQSIKESKQPHSILLKHGDKLSLDTILSAALVTASPNAILMLANKVIGSNQHAMKYIKEEIQSLDRSKTIALNIRDVL